MEGKQAPTGKQPTCGHDQPAFGRAPPRRGGGRARGVQLHHAGAGATHVEVLNVRLMERALVI